MSNHLRNAKYLGSITILRVWLDPYGVLVQNGQMVWGVLAQLELTRQIFFWGWNLTFGERVFEKKSTQMFLQYVG